MNRLAAYASALVLAGGLSACGPTPAVIADLNEDKVVVRSGIGTGDAQIRIKARQGCGLHGRVARPISMQCLDEYCLARNHLFACTRE